MFKTLAVVSLMTLFSLAVSRAEDAVKTSELTRFDPVQIRGDLKVTLLEISRSTLFTDRHVQPELRKRHAARKGTFAVPCLEIAFLVERIGEKPIKQHSGMSSGVRVFRNGKQIDEVKGVVPGGDSAQYDLGNQAGPFHGGIPTVRDKKLTKIRRVMLSGIVVRDGDDIRIEFEAGHGEEIQKFSFDHVPIR